MATVHLARQLDLGRLVALKQLEVLERADPSAAQRFLREARMAGSLSHPNIVTVSEYFEDGGTPYIAMEYVDGGSLRPHVAQHLTLAQIAGVLGELLAGLAHAERQGIVHRDIKPENIMLHDGAALVADFGIALAVSTAGGNRMTETGLSLGTPGYMSPEQATGERVLDARADVYSLGCLLYEMLVGEPPHTGPTIQAVIAAVVTKEAEPVSDRRPSVPANVEAAVHKALAKLPADRFATAEAFVRALSESGTTAPITTIRRAAAKAPDKRRAFIVGGALLGLAAVAILGWMRPQSSHQFMNRYPIFLRDNEGLAVAALGGHIAVSPDGRRIVYVGRGEGNTRLWIKEADQVAPTPIPGTDGAVSPVFSPDGRQLAFPIGGRTVRILSLEGGSPLTLTDSANTTAVDWGDDGYVYFEADSGINRIRATGGPTEPVYKFGEHVIGTEWPMALPGGKGVVFRVRHDGQSPADFEIVAQPLPKGEAHVLLRGVYARYSPTGHLIVVTSDGKLLAVPFDPAKLALTGPPVSLYEGLQANPFAAGFALSPTGTLIYETASQSSSREVVWVTRDGLASPVDPAWKQDGTTTSIALAPNGKAIAVELQRNAKSDIWVKQLPAGPFSRITFGDTNYFRPSWSPDGSQVLFLADRGDGAGVATVRRADGVGPATHLLPKTIGFGHLLESNDGRWLILRRVVTDLGNGDILAAKVGDTSMVTLVGTPARETTPALSPDGKWLAYASDESGTFEIYVRPFPDVSTARWQISTAGGSYPLWSRSGKELFYRNNKNELVAATVITSPTFSVGAQKSLFSLSPFTAAGPVPLYAVAPDDKRFLMMRETAAGESGLLVVSQNWFEELRGRMRR
jgi:serine/threonine-protein kinase